MAVPSLRHNCANAMALLCHSIGTTDESLILAPVGSIRKEYPALSLVSDVHKLSGNRDDRSQSASPHTT